MTSTIVVSLPDELIAEARAAVVAGRAASLSAYVVAAMREKATLDDLRSLLDELLSRSGGPLTDEECRFADAALGF